jgi:NAD(P)-dependent dehydrogenase (short-subunit alcohol dehydrogenase family)
LSWNHSKIFLGKKVSSPFINLKNQTMKFNDKIVWITGASSGIGKSLALEFSTQGAKVAVSARRKELLDELVAEIEKAGGKAHAFPCDVEHEVSIQTCVQDIIKHFGRLDVAVANAGCGVMGKVEVLTAQDWDRQLRINVIGLAITAKYALAELKKTKGRLVLVGSVAAYLPNPMAGAYGASKAAVHNIGETLQSELIGTGVSCTTIHPGFVDSDITRVDNEGNYYPGRKDPRPANLMWPTDKAAKVMVNAIAARKKVFVFTGHGKVLSFMGKHFPNATRKMMAKQMAKMMK